MVTFPVSGSLMDVLWSFTGPDLSQTLLRGENENDLNFQFSVLCQCICLSGSLKEDCTSLWENVSMLC